MMEGIVKDIFLGLIIINIDILIGSYLFGIIYPIGLFGPIIFVNFSIVLFWGIVTLGKGMLDYYDNKDKKKYE